nr:hypothetical protein [uncultured Noviherbaspirillum sp.]
MRSCHIVLTTLAFLAVLPARAATSLEGYLCCNMRSDGSWISDINYIEEGKTLIPAGTPLKVIGQGRQRVRIEILGRRQALGNDYSRDLDLDAFASRYVVSEDPSLKLASYPENIRAAITAARLTPGMTREQVFMAVGYPVSSENPSLSAATLRFWTSSFAEFRVNFDERGLVTEVFTDPETRKLVVYAP